MALFLEFNGMDEHNKTWLKVLVGVNKKGRPFFPVSLFVVIGCVYKTSCMGRMRGLGKRRPSDSK